MKYNVKELLNPESIAIVGASSDPSKWGYEIMNNIIKAGFKGKIFPVNPKGGQIQGIKAYKSILDIPERIDMVSICIAAEYVPGIIREAVEKDVKISVIFSNGFREAGRQDLEDKIQEIIKGSNLRIIGPNIQGIINTQNNLANIFNMSFPQSGRVAIMTQSGSVSAYITEKMDSEKVGISTLINLGNQIDMCECDFLEYFSESDESDVIAIYLEGPRDKKRFKEAIKKASLKKPVLIMKPGSSPEGKLAALSHTASIAGNDLIFTYACKQYGIIRCSNMTEFLDSLQGFALCNLPKGDRVIIFTSSGGVGSIVVDELYSKGLKLAKLPEEAINEIKARTKKDNGIGSVMDLAESLENWKIVGNILKEKYEDYFDSYFFMIADGIKDLELVVGKMALNKNKTSIVSYMSDGIYKEKSINYFRDNKIPVYECPDRAVTVLKNMCWYSKLRSEKNG